MTITKLEYVFQGSAGNPGPISEGVSQ